ncbi:hypothetical protein CLF_109632 [Clonorchis sinensis]|uniref:Uncharacterized protein n=1 Tax=Clonorchis sinensis TaxID=79923 RepID=G7YJL7_CLOSI|nr:hypothetical protein CLF_109632 [Clonorchis sinensis]
MLYLPRTNSRHVPENRTATNYGHITSNGFQVNHVKFATFVFNSTLNGFVCVKPLSVNSSDGVLVVGKPVRTEKVMSTVQLLHSHRELSAMHTPSNSSRESRIRDLPASNFNTSPFGHERLISSTQTGYSDEISIENHRISTPINNQILSSSFQAFLRLPVCEILTDGSVDRLLRPRTKQSHQPVVTGGNTPAAHARHPEFKCGMCTTVFPHIDTQYETKAVTSTSVVRGEAETRKCLSQVTVQYECTHLKRRMKPSSIAELITIWRIRLVAQVVQFLLVIQLQTVYRSTLVPATIASFIDGQTTRELHTIIGEHKKRIKKPPRNAEEYQTLVKHSAMAVHVLDTGHRIDLNSVEVLRRGLRFTPQRLIYEVVEIIKHHSVNRIEGRIISKNRGGRVIISTRLKFTESLLHNYRSTSSSTQTDGSANDVQEESSCEPNRKH